MSGFLDASPTKKQDFQMELDVNDPNRYKKVVSYKPHSDIEDIHDKWARINDVSEHYGLLKTFVKTLLEENPSSERALTKATSKARRNIKSKANFTPKKADLLRLLRDCHERAKKIMHAQTASPSSASKRLEIHLNPLTSPEKKQLDDNDNIFLDRDRVHRLSMLLVRKKSKSESGVTVITVLTSPFPMGQSFSCEWDCYYCPNEPNQPRSYLHDEPSVLRANYNNFDPILQFTDRAYTLRLNGHVVDKVEILVLGGTWESYPQAYQESFVRDLFFAANCFGSDIKREKNSLEVEQILNEGALTKIIGITLETRPDTINPDSIRTLRRYGCTRVQLGLQHTDDRILKKINRQCTTEQAMRAIRLLKDNCFKIDIHLMPNLPGSSPELDTQMFEDVLHNEHLQCDQWKIYPCEVVPWTVIKDWFDSGKFVPYPDATLIEVMLQVKSQVHPWIRLNRVIRDIPGQYILGGINSPSLRQQLQLELIKRGTRCRCIRCREIGIRPFSHDTIKLMVRTYSASYGTEHFISIETIEDELIIGFLRLRLTPSAGDAVFPVLNNCTLIRELHVYGKMTSVSKNASESSDAADAFHPTTRPQRAQHMGIGRRLLAAAEKISLENGYAKIAVISGVGVRNYYRKSGYKLYNSTNMDGYFQIKDLSRVRASYYLARNIFLKTFFRHPASILSLRSPHASFSNAILALILLLSTYLALGVLYLT